MTLKMEKKKWEKTMATKKKWLSTTTTTTTTTRLMNSRKSSTQSDSIRQEGTERTIERAERGIQRRRLPYHAYQHGGIDW